MLKTPTPILAAISMAMPGLAQASGPLPSGGHFVAGTGSIGGSGNALTVNQTTTRGIIDWDSFSIGDRNIVNINNGSGATLNRVSGAPPSSILGTLSATGSVYLINPHGIVIGGSGTVSTGGRFVASTLDVDNNSFMNGGALVFNGTPSASNSTIANLGTISSSGGDVFLIASSEIDNVGTIRTPNGSTELVAGQQVLLQDSSTSRQLFVQSGSTGTLVNRGDVDAVQISLQAADGNIYALAGNHSVLRATGTSTRDGHVWLLADTGRVWLDGTVEAHNADGKGGTVDTSATRLRIAGGPTITANQWNITAPSFTIDGLAAPVFQGNLDRGTSIKLQTTGANGSTGDIDVASSIHWTGAASLTLGAYHTITIDAAAYVKNCGTGNLTLRADSQAIDGGGGVTNNGTVDWSASQGIVSAFYDMNGTYKPGKLVGNKSWAAPAYSGLVTQITAYELVNSLADLENVAHDLTGNYALGKDIDASATSAGTYAPIGNGVTPFMGQFDGQGHSVGSLYVWGTVGGYPDAQPLAIGLFGTLGSSAVVRDLNVYGNALLTSTVDDRARWANGAEAIVAAYNYGTIVHVNASGTIDDLGARPHNYGYLDQMNAGGLVGVNHGTIVRSSSSVNIVSGGSLGGLVAENDGHIDQSFATGALQGVGLLAGDLGSPGSVTGFAPGFTAAFPGGLVATNNGTISRSYATGTVTNSDAMFGSDDASLVYTNNGTISQSFATGRVQNDSGSVWPGHGIAVANYGSIASDVYWDMDSTEAVDGVGYSSGPNASSRLTAGQMTLPSSFAGYDFGQNGVWAMPANGSHPVLRWQLQSGNGG